MAGASGRLAGASMRQTRASVRQAGASERLTGVSERLTGASRGRAGTFRRLAWVSGGLVEGGGTDVPTDRRMDGWTETPPVFYRTLSPFGAAAQKGTLGRYKMMK